MRNYLLISVLATVLTTSAVFCQQKTDSSDIVQVQKKPTREKFEYPKPIHWNVIKINPTPMLLWSNVRNITVSYERLVKRNQSIAVQIGYLEFPALFTDTIANLVSITSRQKWGINVSAEYRFYLGKRNSRPAPDGVYLAPYLSYYGFHFKNGLDVLHTSVDQGATLKGDLNVVNIGITLGYQFIFWKRLSLDLALFGPSFSAYSGSLELQGAFDEGQISTIEKELVDKLINRFPLIGTLFSGETLRQTGSKFQLSPGFRYSVSIGFHF